MRLLSDQEPPHSMTITLAYKTDTEEQKMNDFWQLLKERGEQTPLEDAAFTADTAVLKKTLAQLTPAHAGAGKEPIVLRYVKICFRAEEQLITLTLTNQELTVEATIPAVGKQNCGFCIAYTKLKRFVGLVRGSRVGFFSPYDGGRYWRIQSGTASMNAATLSAAEFPTFPLKPEVAAVSIEDTGRFIGDLEKVRRFVSQDGTRQTLLGVNIEYERDHLQLAATNGKRLFYADSAECPQEFPGFILPAAAATALTKVFARETAALGCRIRQNSVIFYTGTVSVESKTIQGQYPNYRQVIPRGFTNEITLSAFVLKWGIDCIAGSARGWSVDMEVLPNALKLVHQDYECRLETEIPAETGTVEAGQKISFNGCFLSDATAAGETLTMRWTDAFTPVTIVNGDYTYVIMPMRNR